MNGSRGPVADAQSDAGTAATFTPGSNVLATGGSDTGSGSGSDTLSHCLSLLAETGDGPVAVVSTDHAPDDVARIYDQVTPAPGSRVDIIDCTGADGDGWSAPETAGVTVTVGGSDLPSVGEATVAALDRRGTPPITGLCIDSVSTLVERAPLQQVYKLLYIVSERVRTRNIVAFYTWDGPTDEKALRILDGALDDRLSVDENGTASPGPGGGPNPGDG